MNRSIPTALLLAGLFFAATWVSPGTPVARAGDPLAAEPGLPEADLRPTVQAEMLAQHDAESVEFQPGSIPSMPAAGPRGTPTSPSLASPGLPNGLQKEVFGFLPYWMLDATDLQWLRYDLLTTIAYFGIAAQSDGSLAVGSNGWNGWYSSAMVGVIDAAHARGLKVVLTVTMMAWDGGAGQAALLGNATARARLVDAIVGAVRDRNADGVNLDFEPVYPAQRDQYTSFVRQLKAGLLAGGVGAHISVCTTAGAATWATGYDLAALVSPGAADLIFVMGYDYSWSGSSVAGAVAPMDSPYMLDVNESVDDFLAVIPGSRLIWGVPYYGRAWRTTSDALNAPTQPGQSAASVAYYYPANLTLAAQHGRRWDPVGQVPWFAYWDAAAGSWVEGYYDDAQSLGIKWDMVNQRGLAGTGMWALLMDQGTSDLWNVLAAKFLHDSTPPAGGIVSLPPVSDSSAIEVTWRAFDAGSGVGSYSVEVRDRAGGAWVPWLTDISWTSAHYLGAEGHAYEFRVSAVDNRGNRQPWTAAALEPGATIQVGGFARVVPEALNVRSGAGLGYPVLEAVPSGSRVAVIGGPVAADGHSWYRVEFDFTEWPSADYPRYAWMASGSVADPYLVPAVAPTVSNLHPTVSGYGVTPRRFTPNGDGVDDGVVVSYALGTDAADVRLDVLRPDGSTIRSLGAGPQTPGPHTIPWDGRVSDGSWAPAGAYLLRVTATDGAGAHIAPVATPDPGALAAWGVVSASAPSGATYVPLAPSRLLDTRIGNGLAGPLTAGQPRTFVVRGRGGVPAAAVAVTGNLTVTNQTAAGYVYLGPDPTASPTSSTLNFPAADHRANGVTLALNAAGSLSATYIAAGGGRTDLVFDVTGYFVPDASGATYVPLAPSRLLDTRIGNGLAGPLTAGQPRTFVVRGRGGVPAAAVAVTGNLTVTNQTAAGYVYLGPDPTASPTSSTLNFPAADHRANGVTLALNAAGSLSATYIAAGGGRTDLVFDVTGYFVPDASGATYVPLAPSRLLDTRIGNGLAGPLTAGQPRTFVVRGRGGVPAAAVAVTGNLTVTNQTAAGYVYLGPDPTASPTSSTLNFPAADHRANGVTLALNAAGSLSATYIAAGGGRTDLVFDVTGYFVP